MSTSGCTWKWRPAITTRSSASSSTDAASGGSVEIRLLTASDLGDYRAIRLASFQNAPDAFGSTYETVAARPLSHFEERLTTAAVFGAYAGPDIVGTACFLPDTGPRELHKGSLTGMYVGPAHRGLGVGVRLVEAVLAHAARHVEQVKLTVVQGNDAAISLYKRLGFTAYGVEPRALRTAGGYVDEILMVKFLRS